LSVAGFAIERIGVVYGRTQIHPPFADRRERSAQIFKAESLSKYSEAPACNALRS
jgi:hypothetical protein